MAALLRWGGILCSVVLQQNQGGCARCDGTWWMLQQNNIYRHVIVMMSAYVVRIPECLAKAGEAKANLIETPGSNELVANACATCVTDCLSTHCVCN